MHFFAFCSKFAANLNFKFPKVVQQHTQDEVANITSCGNKFHMLSSRKRILKID